MLKRFLFFIKYFIYWILFFFILKLLFLVYFFRESQEYFVLWDNIFAHGLRLDISASGYILLLPLLVILASLFLPGKWSMKIIRIYTFSILALISILAAIDLGIYHEWGFRLDATPLYYLANPGEAAASTTFGTFIGLSFVASLILVAFIIAYNYLFKNEVFSNRAPWWSIFPALAMFGFMILPIRGGLGTSPINIGVAYFSNINFINHAAINLPWNILYSATNFETATNPYDFMPSDQAEKLADEFKSDDSDFFQVLNSERPNIILILLESVASDAVGCINAGDSITPELDQLAKNGILFNNCYASGNRTDKGLVAVFGGFPSQPTTSIIKFPNKTQTLPSIPKSLINEGYHTRYYYGGDIEFANYQSYLLNAGFEKLISIKDFEASERICNWGVPDEFLFEKMVKELVDIPKPYFVACITLNSHPPYDIPDEPAFPGEDEKSKYLSSVFYTDFYIGKFIESLQAKNLLENTLVILISDHGSRWPSKASNSSPISFHIPMIWYGDVLSAKDTVITEIVNQTDLAASMLSQLKIPISEFEYSNNVFSTGYAGKTVYSFNNGYGFISDTASFIYNRAPNEAQILSGNLNEESIDQGKAFYQVLYEDIIGR